MKDIKTVGLTKGAGFQIGVRKTIALPPQQAWEFLFSDEGIKLWLGEFEPSEFELKKNFRTEAGITGKLNLLKPYSHVRLSWKKPSWHNTSSLQLRVIDNKGKSTISFHQDKLLNSGQRQEMEEYWDNVISRIDLAIQQKS